MGTGRAADDQRIATSSQAIKDKEGTPGWLVIMEQEYGWAKRTAYRRLDPAQMQANRDDAAERRVPTVGTTPIDPTERNATLNDLREKAAAFDREFETKQQACTHGRRLDPSHLCKCRAESDGEVAFEAGGARPWTKSKARLGVSPTTRTSATP